MREVQGSSWIFEMMFCSWLQVTQAVQDARNELASCVSTRTATGITAQNQLAQWAKKMRMTFG